MRHADIVIAGGGLAGSTAAAMLARDGFDVTMIDPHVVYPPDLRAEKLDGGQVAMLRRTGFAPPILRAATFDGECWIARRGRVVEKRPGDQHGIMYDTLVNTMRAQIAPRANIVHGKVAAIANGEDRQKITLSTGAEMSARLVVVANGLNVGLRHGIGIRREIVSPCHSITIAFDLKPVGRARFEFPALTYYGEHVRDRIAYLTLFPIGAAMRANFMVYRRMDDPWLRRMREMPEAALFEMMPGLRKLVGEVEVVGPVKVRPADVYVTRDYVQPGVVLVGDAFGTSCPAAGTGTSKVFTDVERLCNVHIPDWMASGGMRAEKIGAFYADPVKSACDAACLRKAYFLRSLFTEESLRWRAERRARRLARMGIGMMRRLLAPARAKDALPGTATAGKPV